MEHIEFEGVSMTSSSYQYVADALHQVRSISFTVCDDSEIIGNSIASAPLLEKISLSGLQPSHCNIINGINQNSNIRGISLDCHIGDYDHSFRNIESLAEYKKPVTKLEIILDYSERMSTFLLSMADFVTNCSLKTLNIYLYCKSVAIPDILHFLESISPNSMLEELVLQVDLLYISNEPKNVRYGTYEDFCSCIQQINNIRRREGMPNFLQVSIHLDQV